jgi:hypothetical protein
VIEESKKDFGQDATGIRELSSAELEHVAGGDFWSWLKNVASDIQEYGQRQLDEHRRLGGR